jgi:hypothetical protein
MNKDFINSWCFSVAALNVSSIWRGLWFVDEGRPFRALNFVSFIVLTIARE